MSSEAAKICIKNDCFDELLLQQHHLPRLDEIACSEAVEVDATFLIKQHYFVISLGNMISTLIPNRADFLPPLKTLYAKLPFSSISNFLPRIRMVPIPAEIPNPLIEESNKTESLPVDPKE